MAVGDDDPGGAKRRSRAQDGADIVRIADLVERQDQGVFAAAGQDVFDGGVFQRRHQGRDTLVDGAVGQALVQVLARRDGHGGLAHLGGMGVGHLLCGEHALDAAVGIGEGREHGMTAKNPYGLAAGAGLAMGTIRARAHGQPCMARSAWGQILPLAGIWT